MKFILGKKIEMTQVWQEDKVVAVTKVQAGPCKVVQVKTEDKDGYKAVQVGFGDKKEKNINKPQIGHTKGLGNFRYLREFRAEDEVKRGDMIDIATFGKGDIVRVTGTSKGKGFQGVVKRWGFAGQVKTHGNKDQLRMPGSIGATGPAHVFKGTRMGGRMGGKQITTTNLEVIDVDVENNILYIKGSVPGARNGLVMIKGEGELKILESEKLKADSKEELKEEVETEEKAADAKAEAVKKEEAKEAKEDKEKKEEKSSDAEAKVDKKEESKESVSSTDGEKK